MHISSNHPFLATSQDVAEIAKPLKKLGICYFTYTKTDYTGARLYMSNHPRTLEQYIQNKWYLTGNVECKPANYKKQTILWSTLPNQAVLDDCARANNIDHGMFMIQPHETYCEYFAFATHHGNEKIVNAYLSNMDLLEKFTQYFKEKAAPAIKLAEDNKIILPFNEQNFVFNDYCNDAIILKHKLALTNLSGRKKLTDRQLECCALLVAGKTAKEIASILGLSSRTVEYYFLNIRLKLKCNNKAELISILTKFIK